MLEKPEGGIQNGQSRNEYTLTFIFSFSLPATSLFLFNIIKYLNLVYKAFLKEVNDVYVLITITGLILLLVDY